MYCMYLSLYLVILFYICFSVLTLKAKFHYASWWATSFEPASVMEFGFYVFRISLALMTHWTFGLFENYSV